MIRLANFLFLALFVAAFQKSEQVDSLKISVYYESLCPDSINFVMNQLVPMMGEFNEYPSWLTLEMIPFGKAKKTKKRNHYTCQHGPRECAGNKLDACAIDVLVTKQYKPLYMRLANFLYCTMNAKDPVKAAHMCSVQTEVNYRQLMKCYRGKEGNKLIEMYAKKTAAILPEVSGSWVPTIIFNDVFNQTQSDAAKNNLYAEVCGFLPDQCQ